MERVTLRDLAPGTLVNYFDGVALVIKLASGQKALVEMNNGEVFLAPWFEEFLPVDDGSVFEYVAPDENSAMAEPPVGRVGSVSERG